MKKFILALLMVIPAIAYAQVHRPPVNGSLTIAANGATSRLQGTNLTVSGCTFQAASGNTGNIYIGGGTVTNASGSNEGIALAPGDPFSNLDITNLNQVWIAGDNLGDVLKYLCN